jgi:hypothetical protein
MDSKSCNLTLTQQKLDFHSELNHESGKILALNLNHDFN